MTPTQKTLASPPADGQPSVQEPDARALPPNSSSKNALLRWKKAMHVFITLRYMIFKSPDSPVLLQEKNLKCSSADDDLTKQDAGGRLDPYLDAEHDCLTVSAKLNKNLQQSQKVTHRFYHTKSDLDPQGGGLDVQVSRHAVRAVNHPQQGMTESRSTPPACGISSEELQAMMQERNGQILEVYGGPRGLACHLRTSPDEGMRNDPLLIQSRQAEFGANTYPRQPSKGFFSFFYDACKNPLLISFAVCSLASGLKSHGIKEGWYNSAAIALAVIFAILVTPFADYMQSLQFLKLNKNEEQKVLVVVSRGGRRIKIPITDLVVGDIAHLEAGDQVPADGLFVNGYSLCVDESTMTGESDPVQVKDGMPFLLSGCKVIDGVATMLVTGVGIRTEWGRLMAELEEGFKKETPLQVYLKGVTTSVRQIGLAVAILMFFIVDFSGHKEGLNKCGKSKAGNRTILDTISVLVLPNGLPFAVTLTLVYAMKRMMVDHALVRRLSACETMGSATMICCDKTGTLTLNDMTVVKTWVAGDFQDVGGKGFSTEISNLIVECIAQNSTAAINSTIKGDSEVIGSPTEKALLVWGYKLDSNFESVKSLSKVLQLEPFNSIKKKAGVIVRVADSGSLHVHWKGAAETILTECDTVWGRDNCKQPITDCKRQELLSVIQGMGASGLRCVAFGFREVGQVKGAKDDEQTEVWKIPEGQLTLTAIIGLKDPCRPGVVEAVQSWQVAGLKVCMITGDNLATAKAIATDCHILQSGFKVIEGATFRSYTAERRRQELPRIAVVAHALPSDKLLMVRTWRECGEVVAVIGDGINDVPALNEADIGLSMSIQGTEAVREVSDIILLDDNFASVVKLVRCGRSIYLNIQKSIQFQLTMNVVAVIINFTAAALSQEVPLTPIQQLWMNIIMAMLGVLALATEPPTDEVLQKSPIGSGEPLISKIVIRNLVVQTLYQVIILLTLHFKGKDMLRLEGPDAMDIKRMILFNAFVLCQLINEVNCRKPEGLNILEGLFDNKRFVGILCSSVALQVVAVEFLSKFASTVQLSWQHWLICILIALLSWPVALLGKLIPVTQQSPSNARLGPSRINNEAWCRLQTTAMAAIC